MTFHGCSWVLLGVQKGDLGQKGMAEKAVPLGRAAAKICHDQLSKECSI